MKLRSLPPLLLIGILILATSCGQKPEVFMEQRTVFQIGDNPTWAKKVFNDSNWERWIKRIPEGQIFWSRTRIDILKSPEDFRPYGIQLEVYGEYEIFWDGVLIGKNGNPGQEHLLEPEGKLWRTFSIPTELTQVGAHVLAIRASVYHFPDHVGISELEIYDYDALLTDQLIETSYLHLFAGAFLIASIYFLFLFLGNRKEYPTLVFSVSCFLFFVLTLMQFIRVTVPIHYSLHVMRLEVIGSMVLGISFLIPHYFSMQFPFPKRKMVLLIYGAILLTLFFFKHERFDFSANNMTISMMISSLGIVVFGVFKKEKGAWLVLLSLLSSIGVNLVSSYGISLFLGFSFILLSMLYLLSIRIKEQRLAYENSLVQSTRLRLELLKKNIQPHFLMNTLTSLMDWVEESPKKGVQFIEALAKEFDLFSQIEDKTLIPIDQEIALCRTHLKIMEYRKEVSYSLEEESIDPKEKIPPAILHTLLENGITHSLPLEDNSIRFKLVYESNNEYKSYTFLTFAARTEQWKYTKEEGTGLKYIKARLTESYDTKWELTSEPTDHGWKNTLKIYH